MEGKGQASFDTCGYTINVIIIILLAIQNKDWFRVPCMDPGKNEAARLCRRLSTIIHGRIDTIF